MGAVGRRAERGHLMGWGPLVDRFAEQARRCTSIPELGGLIERAARELGFDHFALLHHASLQPGAAGLVRLDTYPPDWAAELSRSGLAAEDPVHLACGRTNAGFAWDRLSELVPLGPRHLQILARSVRHGLGAGFTVPANVPGEPGGSCSFAVRTGRTLPVRNLLGVELVGAHAFRAARRLSGYPARSARPRLSPREQQCLRLIAAGKSDWEVGRILGIAEETARQYAKRARAAYDVVSRTQLVVCGLRDGWVGFDEAIPPPGGMG